MISSPPQIFHKTWLWWLPFLALMLAIFLPSLGSSPIVVWQDEVQIVDYGRVMLDPGTDWAVSWSTHEHKPVPPVSYLGCIGAELAYRFTGTVLGSRLFCIAGGFLLGSLVLGLMKEPGRPPVIGLLFAGLIVLDPGLVQSYRAGRLDAMAMAFVLAGALCLKLHARNPDWRWLVAASLALACAPYIWVRAAMSIPAALLPLVFASEMPTRKLLRTILALVVLTAVIAALLLPPAWHGLQQAGTLAYSPLQVLGGLAANRGGDSPSLTLLRMLEDTLRCCGLAVPLLLLAAFGLATSFTGRRLTHLRKSLVALVVLATLLFQFKTTTALHHFTALYLVPLLVLLASKGMDSFAPDGFSGKRVRWLIAAMAMLMAYHGVATVDRSYGAWLDRASFSPEALQPVVKALPTTPKRLVVDDFRLYFLLRSSGFQPFYLFTQVDKTTHEETLTPGLLVGGNTPMWATIFETQLHQPLVKQLPLGYRLVVPAPN